MTTTPILDTPRPSQIVAIQNEKQVIPNLFQGRTEPQNNTATFPAWDILPPNQIINPRLKQQ